MINITQLRGIHFPVFKLGKTPPLEHGGVLYYEKETLNHDNAEITRTFSIIDDTNLPFETLGRRRLALSSNGVKLQKIPKSIYFLGDFFKVAKAGTWFIDNSGKPFTYTKTVSANLLCKKITKIFPTKGLGIVFEVHGISSRFKAIQHPAPEQYYAGILEYNGSYIFYGFYGNIFKPSRRRI